MRVTAVGQALLEGTHRCDGGVPPRDGRHFTIALLCHDIGYVRGVCRRDAGALVSTGVGAEPVEIPAHGTDAALTPYHVDRSKPFVYERFGAGLLDSAPVVAADVMAE